MYIIINKQNDHEVVKKAKEKETELLQAIEESYRNNGICRVED
jgi:hypothetical protein